MNLLSLSNVIGIVNPQQTVTWTQSTGYTTDAAGKRSPTSFSTPVNAQIQGLSGSDLRHVDGLNITGVMRSVIMLGNIQGVVRADQQGGDILTFPEIPGGLSKDWLVVQVMETWPEWCRVIVVLQNP